MPKHQEKLCPLCQSAFECKAGSITVCQCSNIALSPVEREYIKAKFDDCLCVACLSELKMELQLVMYIPTDSDHFSG